MADRLSGMLSLSKKAGALKTGEFSCEKSLKDNRSKLCIIASDASDNTTKKFEDLCKRKKVECRRIDMTKAELGHLAGQSERTMASVEDNGFAQSILKLIDGGRIGG
ncbi:MAG: L7Ae/L30e/S12e/Gadd45 family ribosomal protein [Eubacteriales bacterium]|nr:L7Ae/L30e/S12e/Gadd45 family ribosomal protein [Eubacteriales bacterium]